MGIIRITKIKRFYLELEDTLSSPSLFFVNDQRTDAPQTDLRTNRLSKFFFFTQIVGKKDKLLIKEFKKTNSRKSVRWSAVPVPCLRRLCLKLKGKQGSGSEGVDDLCFHTYGEFSPSPPSLPPPSPSVRPPLPGSRLESQS